MNLIFMLAFTALLILYGGLNYYIGLRLWQTLGIFVPFLNDRWYWIIFWTIAFAYLVGRMTKKFLPSWITHTMIEIGSYWLGAMVYFAVFYLFMDILYYLTKGRAWDYKTGPFAGALLFLIVLGLGVYGSWSARSPKVVDYHIQIHKPMQNIKNMKVVMVSDIHLGIIMNNGRLLEMVESINRLKPDLVLLAGDIIDEKIEHFIEQNMGDSFSKLNPPLGTYAVMGNHEYIGGHWEEIYHHLTQAGITVLRDEAILVKEGFYVVGREDAAYERFTGKKRKTIEEIMEKVDTSLPVLLLYHQPVHLEEHQKSNIDLQVSGHTHRGQLFPFHLITNRIFEVDWGYLQKENLHVIVSSGYGTWGPPLRVGHQSEIVQIHIEFAKE